MSSHQPLSAEALSRLPEHCYIERGDGSIAIIERGVAGVRQVPLTFDNNAATLNSPLGITPEQERAMHIGAMFGFHVPGADPRFYLALTERSSSRRILDEIHRTRRSRSQSGKEVRRAA